MKVALVHDWLTSMGGAEQVLINFHKLFPDAPVYTTFYTPKNLSPEIKKMKIKTSFLQGKKPVKNHRNYLPLMPLAFRKFDLSEYDLVLSDSSSCAKSVRAKNGVHICYCHTPMRYAWDYEEEYLSGMSPVKRIPARVLLFFMRHWDKRTAKNVDYFIANSSEVRGRIERFYGRKAAVINPPVRCSIFKPGEKDGDYYLIVTRFVPYKRVDLAIQACINLNRKLIVVGDGPENDKLHELAKGHDNITFTGKLDAPDVQKYLSSCKAFLFPAREDAGIAPVEAMSCGRPVICYGKGGVLDTVIDGKTGVYFDKQTSKSLEKAILKFEKMKFDKKFIRKHAENFDEKQFCDKITEYINSCMSEKDRKF